LYNRLVHSFLSAAASSVTERNKISAEIQAAVSIFDAEEKNAKRISRISTYYDVNNCNDVHLNNERISN